MSVYIDNAFAEGDWGKWNGGGHLQADTDEELHEFAARLGLKREWAQIRPKRPESNHYDCTRSKREMALRLGAVDEEESRGAARRNLARMRARDEASA